MTTVINATKVARYYRAQTSEDQVVFAVTPQIGGPEHHADRWRSYPELEKLSPHRLLPVINWAHSVVDE
jgi:bis(5'-nucleosidyl)-tetraphosphatase